VVVVVSVYHDLISKPEAIEYVYGVSVGLTLVVTVVVVVSVATYFVRVYVGGETNDFEVVVPES
jgi:hypothetical protein